MAGVINVGGCPTGTKLGADGLRCIHSPPRDVLCTLIKLDVSRTQNGRVWGKWGVMPPTPARLTVMPFACEQAIAWLALVRPRSPTSWLPMHASCPDCA